MFQKSIQAIIDQGVRDLEAVVKQTQQAAIDAKVRVSTCQSEIQSLVTLAKQVPEKVFDRYSNVLVGTIEEYSDSPNGFNCDFRLNNNWIQLRGFMGDERLKRGKYRVVVLLEPLS